MDPEAEIYLTTITLQAEVIPQNTTPPGVDVMMTIFANFCQFSAKKLAFFSETHVMIKFLQTLAVHSLSKKRQYFRQIFGRKYFLNHNVGPRSLMEIV
jgi:hypothetical protein